jgi:hypothetical protein
VATTHQGAVEWCHSLRTKDDAKINLATFDSTFQFYYFIDGFRRIYTPQCWQADFWVDKSALLPPITRNDACKPAPVATTPKHSPTKTTTPMTKPTTVAPAVAHTTGEPSGSSEEATTQQQAAKPVKAPTKDHGEASIRPKRASEPLVCATASLNDAAIRPQDCSQQHVPVCAWKCDLSPTPCTFAEPDEE